MKTKEEKPDALKLKRIKAEKRRLDKIYNNIEEKKKETVQGLVQRAAYMRISLEDFEEDLDKNGFTELFSQGNQEPYERKRPAADLYNTMNAGYQKIIKQLSDLLPKDEPPPQKLEDGFEDFVNSRADD